MARVVGDADRATPLLRTIPASPMNRWGADWRIVVPALALGGAIVVGMALDLAPLTTAGSLAAIVVALIAPAVGLATIAFMGPLPPPLVIPAPGFNAILVGAVVLGCIYRLPIDRPRIRPTAPILMLSGFVLYVGIQQTPEMVAGYAGNLGYLVYSLFRELLTGFGFVLAAAYVLSGRSPLPFIGVGLVAAVLSAVVAIVPLGLPVAGPLVAGLTDLGADRAIGSFGNPNYFGVYQAIATITAVGWSINTGSTRLRLVLLAASVILGASLAVSLSRGGMVAFAAGLACLAFSRYRPRAAAVIAAGLLVAAVVLAPIFVEWRLTVTSGSASASAYASLAQSDEGRLAAALAGPQLFLTSPIFGIGWGHYSFMAAQFAGPGLSLAAHNWYVAVLAEGGIVGIVMWVLVLGALAIALRSRPAFPRSMGLGVLGAYAVGSLFLEAPVSFATSVLAILVIVAAMVSRWPRPQNATQPPVDKAIAEPPDG